MRTELNRHSPEARKLIERAERLQGCADRAFARYMRGEVRSSSGAAALASKAAEAWADVRIGIAYGDLIEADKDEAYIAEIEADYEEER